MNRRVLKEQVVKVGSVFITIEVVKFNNQLYMGYVKLDDTNTIRSTGFCMTPADALCDLIPLLRLELTVRNDSESLLMQFFQC